ncbi:unnamed protein product [Microthlaspi erraticum]|uniref:Phorbol-ester/DAG-type domain-containing protein n=1 Tax=Microthlaspi erraticum TaxID=1685480 RepID=A0A6D2HIH7_9BRAS|nr:unnamed protein product [Microthlaspi erraticum]
MAELKHFSHECTLTLPEMVGDDVCNICLKDGPVAFSCSRCNFDICEACSELPEKVSHDFHPEHPLEFFLRQYDRKPGHVICSGCGDMCSGSFYECKECEIYLDLGCALMENIFRPGPDAKTSSSSCLFCELPLSPSSICYGCVHCYSFVHERCFHLPKEIQHPAHLEYPLRRLDYTQVLGDGRVCDACNVSIVGIPFSCGECAFDLHLRCADSLLRGLVHKSHHHKLFYKSTDGENYFLDGRCKMCKKEGVIYEDSFYCMQCDWLGHFECLEILESVLKQKFHIHPLVCSKFLAEDDFMEYCGVCETMVHRGHHVYSCQECDFLGHIECILREVVPSPLYLKDLYSCGKVITRSTNQQDSETNELENKLMVNGLDYIHVMISVGMDEYENCDMCNEAISVNGWRCQTCGFHAHHYCGELVVVSRSYRVACTLCNRTLGGKVVSCMDCGEIYHSRCIELGRQKLVGHPLHAEHMLKLDLQRGSNCVACKLKMSKYGFNCYKCDISFHIECIEAAASTAEYTKSHKHYLYKFWSNDSSLTRPCRVCNRPCGASFYGCIFCSFKAHGECIGHPEKVKSQQHRHTVDLTWSRVRTCFLCGLERYAEMYLCRHCEVFFHKECLISMDTREAATEEEQLIDIYLMYLDCDMVKKKTICSIHHSKSSF